MKKTRLIIARHGNTFSKDEIVRRVGTTDLPLVATGLAQGRALGSYLKNHQLTPNIIITSQLKRAIQTAEQAQITMQTNLPIKTTAEFNEIDYGPDENQPEEDVIARIGTDALRAWESSAMVPMGWKVTPEDIIQTWLDVAGDILKHHQEQTVLIITSNGIARFAPYITGDFEAFHKKHSIKIATGALCVFEHTPETGKWECLQWNTKPGFQV